MRDARHAGSQLAARITAASTTAAAPITAGSRPDNPNSTASATLPKASAARKTETEADQRHHADLLQDQRPELLGLRAERLPEPELARALLDVVREHAVQADAREQRRERGESRRQRREQTIDVHVVVDALAHRLDDDERHVGRDVRHHARDHGLQRVRGDVAANVDPHRLEPSGHLAARVIHQRRNVVLDRGVLRVRDHADDLDGVLAGCRFACRPRCRRC